MAHLSEQDIDQLTGNSLCFLHYHPKDLPTVDDLVNAQAINPGEPVTSDTTLGNEQTLVLVDTSAGNVTITLPNAADGREYQIIKTTAAYLLYVVPQVGETILGSSSGLIVSNLGTCLHLKSTTDNFWMAI